MMRSTCLVLMALTVLAVIFSVSSDSLDQDRLDLPGLQERPFCNAFTGCGGKRSNQRDNGDIITRSRQNKLYALWQQKMAEIEALNRLLEERKNEYEV
nr:Tx-939 [Heteropoda pingtungensis]